MHSARRFHRRLGPTGLLPGAAVLLLAGCASLPGARDAAPPTPADDEGELLSDVLRAPIAERRDTAESAQSRFYRKVLLGEIAGARGQHETAALALRDAAAIYNHPTIARHGIREALAAGRDDLALELGRLWKTSGESTPESHGLLLRLAVKAGDAEAARGHLGRLVETHEGPDTVFQAMARALSDIESNRDLALSLVREAVEQYAATPAERSDAEYALGLLAFSFESFDQAAAASERALDRTDEALGDQKLLLLAGALLRAGRVEDAVAAVESRLSDAQEPLAIRRSFAELLRQSGAPAAAREQLRVLLESRPDDRDALLALGTVAREQGDDPAARDALEQVWQSEDGDRAEAALQLGMLAEDQGDPGAAADWYQRAADAGESLRAGLRLSRIDAEAGRIAEARARLERLREENPGLAARLLRAEGELLVRERAFSAAVDLLESGVAAYPRDTQMRYTYALALEQDGAPDAAEAELRAIIDDNPDNAAALNALGYMLAVSGERLEEAEDYIRRALELSPEDPAIIDSMGWVLFKQGRAEEALTYLERAHGDYPDPEVAAHLGEVLWTLGKRERARSVWDEALAEHPDHPTLRETVERLTP